MKRAGKGRYEVTLPHDAAGRSWRSYYVEGGTGSGGVLTNGSAESPFQVQLVSRRPSETGSAGGFFLVVGLSVLLPLGLICAIFVFHRRRRNLPELPRELPQDVGLDATRSPEEDLFWFHLVDRLRDQRGEPLERSLIQIKSQVHTHPTQGRRVFDVPRLRLELRRVRQMDLSKLMAAVAEDPLDRAGESDTDIAPETSRSAESIEEDRFWFELLSPLLDQSGEALENAMRNIDTRAHCHPTQGRRLFDMSTLRRQLERVRRMDSPPVTESAESVPATRVDPVEQEIESGVDTAPSRPGGFSSLELLTVLALIGMLVAIGALSVAQMATPLEAAGDTLTAMIEQTRSKAIYTTRVHRVRPLSDDRLIVEYAGSCSSVSWTYDAAITLELPRQVTLADTSWSVCFNRRGLSSTNLVIELQHPDNGRRELELFKGGVMRWRS